MIALDLPGFGATPMPEWEISIEAYGRLLHDFCAALEVGDCAVVGNSMGGFISAEAASSEPAGSRKLVLVSAAGVSHARLRRRARRDRRPDAGRRGTVDPAQLQERGLRRPRVRWAFGWSSATPDLRGELLWEFF